MTRKQPTHIFMFLKRMELLDLGHDELCASWLYMAIQFVCPLASIGSAEPLWGSEVMIINPG